jgi:hypothetical protein
MRAIMQEVAAMKQEVAAMKQEVAAMKQEVAAMKQDVAAMTEVATAMMEAAAIMKTAAGAKSQDEHAEIFRGAIELAKLHGHGNPVPELALSAYGYYAAGDAGAAERGMREERQRMAREKFERWAREPIDEMCEELFQPVPFSEIVNSAPTERKDVSECPPRHWVRGWERELLNEDFLPLIDRTDAGWKTVLPDTLKDRQAALAADYQIWPYQTESGFKKFLRRWVDSFAAIDGLHDPTPQGRTKKVEELFQQAKDGRVHRNLLDTWRFWRASQAALEKWAGVTRKEFRRLLGDWVQTLPRNTDQPMTKEDFEKQVDRHFEKALAGKVDQDTLQKWRAFRSSLAKN